MEEVYLNEIADHGITLINYIGLVDDDGNELTGGDPAYARKVVTMERTAAGIIRPDADLTFDIPESTTVAGWRAYSEADDSVLGDIDYGGADLDPEAFVNQGEYKLLAAGTGIVHEVPGP